MYSDTDALSQKVDDIDSRIEKQDADIDKLEAFSRRDNIVFHGLAESQDESFNKCKDTVVSVLNNFVKARHWVRPDIICAHRIGKKQTYQERPRPLIARFSLIEDKITVLKHRDNLRVGNIGVANDLTKLQRETLADLKSKGQIAFYKNGNLITRPGNPDKSVSNRTRRYAFAARKGTSASAAASASTPTPIPESLYRPGDLPPSGTGISADRNVPMDGS
ncbi:uncharacterized protein [Haliotis asinina]|uniref:uncharacterized protein n=1 Tax=Haliotis asinina TaxID=109174 RepID=UPI003531ACC6